LPTGKSTIVFDFKYGGGGKGGTGAMTVNGQQVASGRVDKTVQNTFSVDETADVGRDEGTPVAEPSVVAKRSFCSTYSAGESS
jgi:arylsulfatase